MFKINIYLKFAIIAACFAIWGLLWATQGFWYAFIFLLVGLGFLASYLLLGTIQSAAELMQPAAPGEVPDVDAAEKQLNLTLFPKLLYPANRSYFYMLKGTIAQMRKDNAGAEKYLKMAQSVKMPTENDQAMIELQMANMAAQSQNFTKAKLHLRNAKALEVTVPQIKDQIKEFDKAMKQSGMMKQAGMQGKKGGMMRPGGKRRRPKMR